MKKIAVISATAAIILSGCDALNNATQQHDSTTMKDGLCEVHAWEDAGKMCKDGQVVSFLPMNYGHPQVPIVAASALCDYSKAIVQNPAGVSCVYRKGRYEEFLLHNPPKKEEAKQADPDTGTSATTPAASTK